MNILITNQCATNKGDRAVLYFMLRELVRHGISDITVSTTNPRYWANYNEFPGSRIQFIPFGWDVSPKWSKLPGLADRILNRIKRGMYHKLFFKWLRDSFLEDRVPGYLNLICSTEYLDAVKCADLVVSTGGHRVTTLLARDAVFPATFDLAIALMVNKKLVLWSQSIGPFKFADPRNKAMVQKILKDCSRICIRDNGSLGELDSMDVSRTNVFEVPESVFGLNDIVKSIRPSDRERILGLSVYMAQKRTVEDNEHYLNSLSAVVDCAADAGYSIRFFPMEMMGSDVPCIEGVIRKCRNKSACSIVLDYPETPEHIRRVSECRLFIGHKTHSVVFALTVGTPVVAIAYHKKTADFMEQFGLSEYCVDDKELSGERLIQLFHKANENSDKIYESEMKTSEEVGARVRKGFAELLQETNRGQK